jgi:hypothetical protein
MNTHDWFRGPWLIVALGMASASGACAPSLEMTGTVLDSATKAPLEGAYVVAIYQEPIRSIAVSTHRCRKVKGMTTGPDGSFHFPVEKLDGESPSAAVAIKLGYYLDHLGGIPSAVEQRRQNKEAYSNRVVYLSKQDEKAPVFISYSLDDVFCTYAKSRVDAAGGAEYIRIALGELRRYGAGQQAISDLEYMIRRLERLPQ